MIQPNCAPLYVNHFENLRFCSSAKTADWVYLKISDPKFFDIFEKPGNPPIEQNCHGGKWFWTHLMPPFSLFNVFKSHWLSVHIIIALRIQLIRGSKTADWVYLNKSDPEFFDIFEKPGHPPIEQNRHVGKWFWTHWMPPLSLFDVFKSHWLSMHIIIALRIQLITGS